MGNQEKLGKFAKLPSLAPHRRIPKSYRKNTKSTENILKNPEFRHFAQFWGDFPVWGGQKASRIQLYHCKQLGAREGNFVIFSQFWVIFQFGGGEKASGIPILSL